MSSLVPVLKKAGIIIKDDVTVCRVSPQIVIYLFSFHLHITNLILSLFPLNVVILLSFDYRVCLLVYILPYVLSHFSYLLIYALSFKNMASLFSLYVTSLDHVSLPYSLYFMMLLLLLHPLSFIPYILIKHYPISHLLFLASYLVINCLLIIS